jgi:outer membrane biosynthesis protein TonB
MVMRIVSLFVLALGFFGASDTVAQNAQPPFIVRDAKVPTYPPIARAAQVVGTVTVDVHVENGTVTKATPRSGPPLLSGETVRNIQTWTFDPGTTGDSHRLPHKVTITTRPVVVIATP